MQSTDINSFLNTDNTDDQSVNIITDSITSDISSNSGLPKDFHVPIVQPVTVKQPLLGPEGGIEDQPAQVVNSAWKEKELGILRFEVISNDSSLRNLELLMNLKNVFSKQLPKMPREYIVRLMFDRFHHSLLIIKRDNVIGGISFRPFEEQGFIEIAFCAITSNEQVKGYGSFLMTHLKEHNRKTGIYHFLTFADNFAIEYFQKQGFTHEITLPREKWKGFIQEYDGGSLMECVIHPNATYLDIPSMVKQQREILNAKIRQISTSHIIYPGLKCFQPGVSRIPIEQIKGIKDSGWVQSVSDTQIATLQKELRRVLDLVKSHPEAWPFLQPVSIDVAPNYYEVIKDPVDISKIEQRLSTSTYYITKYMFIADLKRMCENCRQFNGEGSYFHIANRLEQFIIQQCQGLP